MPCRHEIQTLGIPEIMFIGIGGAGINTVTIRQPMECANCGLVRYRWSKYNEDEDSVAYRNE